VVSIALTYVIMLLGGRFVWDRATPEEFTFPEGFVGQVYVIYDSAAGRPLLTRERTWIYHLPASGLLVTKANPPDAGWLDEHFYYRRPDGTRSLIRTTWDVTIADTPENRADTTTGVYSRTWGQGTYGYGACTLRYTSFFVGRKADVLDNRGVDGFERYVDSACRDDRLRKHEAPKPAH
jgi:hypothetical protein